MCGLSALSWAAGQILGRIFLQQFKNDALATAAIRTLLSRVAHPWALTRVTANDAIDQLTVLLIQGTWHVHAPVLEPDSAVGSNSDSASEEEDEAEIVRPPAARREPGARPQPVAEEGSLPLSADEAAIAVAMKLASKLGIPFCEECAKTA